MSESNSVITGSGSYIPELIQRNDDFINHEFYNADGSKISTDNAIIVRKFKAITGIEERRYLSSEKDSSYMAEQAALKAIADAHVDPEILDYIIFAHNFGNVKSDSNKTDQLPALASRLKHTLRIKNPSCVAYDILFGCPGWVEGMIQAHAYIKSGMAKKCLVVGSETLSRVVDKHDRDSMIYADGAGACILEAQENTTSGILSHATMSHTYDEAYYLFMTTSYNKDVEDDNIYMKMYGRKIYEYALKNVPIAIKNCIDKSGEKIEDIKKIFIHQANEKMDAAILKRLYKLYDIEMPNDVMPMSIQLLGNSSVATVPTVFDLVKNGKIEGHSIHPGDVIVFASVGAGMNINAITYRV